ncbi:MAG: sulfatase [Thermodesulfobacteriota bacterium]
MNNSKQPNIIVLILDALRADHVSCYGYHRNTTPNIDRISAQGTIFLETIATAPWTVPSVASIFTGCYPSEHGATQENPHLDDLVPTLAQILSENGYETIGFSTNPWFNPGTNLRKGFNEFNLFSNEKSRKKHIKRKLLQQLHLLKKGSRFFVEPGNSHDIVDEISTTVASRTHRNSKPFFLYAHFMDPHLPYEPYKEYIRRMIGNDKGMIKKIMDCQLIRDGLVHVRYNLGLERIDKETIDLFKLAYDAAILQLDDAIGALIECLEKAGALDSSLIIIAADHGENIGDHRLMDHQLCLYDTLLKVPLVIIGEGFPRKKRYEKQVQLHQLFDTILEGASINRGDRVNGAGSLQRMIKDSTGLEYAFSEYARPDQIKSGYLRITPALDARFDTRLKSIRTPRFKYIQSENGDDELYNLESDPGEEKNILSVNEEILHEFKKVFVKWQSNLTVHSRSKHHSSISNDAIANQLKGLGYM